MSNPASSTAFGPTLAVAAEQYTSQSQRLIQDELAYQFLPPTYKIVTSLFGWPGIRQLNASLAEKRGRGVWGGVLCRKRYIDERLVEALDEGIQAVINIGAGLDTRLYRLPAVARLPVMKIERAMYARKTS